MHQPILKGLLTRLGIHGPHIHFEGSHQGAASKQVLRMDNLPEQNHKQPVRLGREKPLGMGVGVAKAGQGPLMILLPPSFLVKWEGIWQATGLVFRGSASAPPAQHHVPSLHCCYMGE